MRRILVMAVWAGSWPFLLAGCGKDVGGVPEMSHSGSGSAAVPADTPADLPFTAPAPLRGTYRRIFPAPRYRPQPACQPETGSNR